MIFSNGRVYVVGRIEKGDFDKFEQIYKRSDRDNLHMVDLRSPGGSVVEAIKIGRLIRKLYVMTNAPWSAAFGPGATKCSQEASGLRKQLPCTCASACFLIWSGGVLRYGDELHIHQISFDKDFYGSLSPAEASVKYEAGLAKVRGYLKEMNIPDSVYEKMVGTASYQTYRLSRLEAAQLSSPPAYEEWLVARCGGYPSSSGIPERMRVNQCWGREAAARVKALEEYQRGQ